MASFTVSWAVGSGTYQQELYLKFRTDSVYQMIASVDERVNTYTIDGLLVNTLYDFRVKTFCRQGTPVDSPSKTLIEFTCPVVTLTAACNGVINYSFPALGRSVSSYDVVLYSNGNVELQRQIKATSSTVSGSFGGLSPSATYKVRVIPRAATESKTNCATVSGSPGPLAPSVVSNPTSVSAGSAQTITLTSSISGTSLVLRWYKDGVVLNNGGDYSGVTTSTLTIQNAGTNTGSYTLRAANTCGFVESSPAVVSLSAESTTITSQPVSQTVCEGVNVTFSVTATGATGYQWQLSTNSGSTWSNISGATNSSYVVSAVTLAMSSYRYRVIVSGFTTVTSNDATLTVDSGVAITTQPTSQTLCAGQNVTFTAVASGSSLSYQWQVSTNGGSTWNDISGANSTDYSITGLTTGLSGNKYRLIVTGSGTGSCTTVTSDVVTLTVPTATANWVNRVIDQYWRCVGVDQYYEQIDDNPCSATYNTTRQGSLFKANSIVCGYVAPCNPPTITTTSFVEEAPPPPSQLETALSGLTIETIYIHRSEDLALLPAGYTHPCPGEIFQHRCNRAFFEVYGNNVYLGDSLMNNDGGSGGATTVSGRQTCRDYDNMPTPLTGGTWTGDGKARYSIITLTGAQAAAIAGSTTNPRINFSLISAMVTYNQSCGTGVGSDNPHDNVTWTRIKRADGTVVYNGCPTGNFATVNILP